MQTFSPPDYEITNQISAEGLEQAEIVVTVSPDLPCLPGHFPDNPILPGVVQVDWAMTLGLELFAIQGRFDGLSAVKFMRIMQPPEQYRLVLKWLPAKSQLIYQYLGLNEPDTKSVGQDAAAPVIYSSGKANFTTAAS